MQNKNDSFKAKINFNKIREYIGKYIFAIANKLLPAEMRAYKKTSYSRSGEDLVLKEIFRTIGIGQGYYVDVGANHPFRCSNTALFDELGWDGICIDPHPQMTCLLSTYRQRAKVIHSAVSSSKVPIIELHYIKGHAALASLSKKNVLESQKIFSINGEIITVKVPNLTLTKILDNESIKFNIDLLDIDVEGGDLDVLQSLDFERYKPRVILIESTSHAQEILEFLNKKGYREAASLSVNKIFISNNEKP